MIRRILPWLGLTLTLLACRPDRMDRLQPATRPVTFHALNDDAAQMAQTEQGRQFIKYLASCALPENEGAFVLINSTRFEFPGSMGLAADWLRRPLTESEQRWVSAGILARTNYFGKQVQISMRHPRPHVQSLVATEAEKREYSIYEGDFFGNLFADPAVAGVALGRRTPEQQADPIFQLRVGTEVDPRLPSIDGKPLSRTGFIITGYSDEPHAHTIHGVAYKEYISVYLKPQAK